MATTNINGTPGQTSYQAIMSVNTGIKLGIRGGQYVTPAIASGYIAGLDSPHIAGNNVAVSEGDQYKKVKTANNDRNYPKPSGYSALGVPTYGDGKYVASTAWARDYAVYSGSVTFATPNGREKKFISQFAT